MEEISVLVKKAQAGDKRAREILIEENLGLVHSIVRRFLGRGAEAEDLFQIGTIGLMKAIDKFDLSMQVKLSTYAVPLIMGEIKRFLRDDGIIKVSRSIKENGTKARLAAQRLSIRLGREPLLSEIEEETGLSREELVQAMEAASEVESIYQSTQQSDGSEIYLVDRVSYGSGNVGTCTPAAGGKDTEKEELLNHLLIQQLLDELPQKERSLITMRYFEDKTQTEVARTLGISQVQVSRLEKKILLRMRECVS